MKSTQSRVKTAVDSSTPCSAMLARLPTSSLPLASLQSKPLAQSETRRHTCCCVQQRPTIWCSLLCGSALGARARTRRSKKCASKTPETHPAVDLFRVPDDPKIELEVLGGLGHGTSVQPVTLLLIHGSYHAAWCYEEHFLSFFREQGFHTYALSLRGQGSGKMPRLPVAGTLEEHASDIAAYVAHLRELHRQPVVVLGHSFGGLMVLQAARALKDEKDGKDGSNGSLAGLVLLCSVPPGGNVGIILRSLFKAPLQALRITWGFVARAFERDADLCQQARVNIDVIKTFLTTAMQACNWPCECRANDMYMPCQPQNSSSSTPTLLRKTSKSTWG